MARYKQYDYDQMMIPVLLEDQLMPGTLEYAIHHITKVLLVCDEEDLLGGTHFSLDGLKLSSNASKEWSGKFEDLRKKQEALERKVKEAVHERRALDKKVGDNMSQHILQAIFSPRKKDIFRKYY